MAVVYGDVEALYYVLEKIEETALKLPKEFPGSRFVTIFNHASSTFEGKVDAKVDAARGFTPLVAAVSQRKRDKKFATLVIFLRHLQDASLLTLEELQRIVEHKDEVLIVVCLPIKRECVVFKSLSRWQPSWLCLQKGENVLMHAIKQGRLNAISELMNQLHANPNTRNNVMACA